MGNIVAKGIAVDEPEQKIILSGKGFYIFSIDGSNLKVLVE